MFEKWITKQTYVRNDTGTYFPFTQTNHCWTFCIIVHLEVFSTRQLVKLKLVADVPNETEGTTG